MIRFSCPHCESPLKISDESAGRKVNCPRCRRPATVPEALSLDDELPAAELDEAPRRRRVPGWAIGLAAGAAVLALALVAVLFGVWLGRGPANGPDGSAGDDLQRIQGRWKIVSVITDGVSTDEAPPEVRNMLNRSFISFEGSQMRTLFPTKSDRAAILLSPGKSPKQITVTWEEQHADGNVEDGIYELSGDRLKLCLAKRAKRGRPTSFDVSKHDQHLSLMILQREK